MNFLNYLKLQFRLIDVFEAKVLTTIERYEKEIKNHEYNIRLLDTYTKMKKTKPELAVEFRFQFLFGSLSKRTLQNMIIKKHLWLQKLHLQLKEYKNEASR